MADWKAYKKAKKKAEKGKSSNVSVLSILGGVLFLATGAFFVGALYYFASPLMIERIRQGEITEVVIAAAPDIVLLIAAILSFYIGIRIIGHRRAPGAALLCFILLLIAWVVIRTVVGELG